MRVSYKWLCDHLDTDRSPQEVGDVLTNLGLEVEGIEDGGESYRSFSVCYVKEAFPHPSADSLRVCRVVTGTGEEHQVVCGAPNARAGMYGIFAPVGSIIPDSGMKLKSSKIRGELSSGMLCSERELGISEEHDGIIDVGEGVEVGTSFAVWRGIDDVVYEIGVTPNRGDCLGMYGVARDLAAAGLGQLKRPWFFDEGGGDEVSGESLLSWSVDEGSRDDCPWVMGCSFSGLKNVESPHWLGERLKLAGMRPISALVDITNYVMLDMGRPAHMYDVSRLSGKGLVVRRSREGEEFYSLHDEEYRLPEGVTVIADEEKVQGIAGIMGGGLSGCESSTEEAFLEVALFSPSKVVRDGRETGIASEARYRFERGVDRASCDWGVRYVSGLVREICGGSVSKVVGSGGRVEVEGKVFMDYGRVKGLTGLDVEKGLSLEILGNLGFSAKDCGDGCEVEIPSWRYDVSTDACLVEEVVRVYGVDKVEAAGVFDEGGLIDAKVEDLYRRHRVSAHILSERGMLETVSMSFCDDRLAEVFGGGMEALRLQNPMVQGEGTMRPSVLAGILPQLSENVKHKRFPLALFEVGPMYNGSECGEQEMSVAGLRSGNICERSWDEVSRKVTVFDVKADALSVLEFLGVTPRKLVLRTEEDVKGLGYREGHSGALYLGKICLGYFGLIEPSVSRLSGIEDEEVYGFEVFVDRIPPSKGKVAKGAWKELLLMPVERDFAFVVDEDVRAGDVVSLVKKVAPDVIRKVGVFDVFRGKGIEEGKKSLALNVEFQPVELSFTDEELEGWGREIVERVLEATGGFQR